MIIALSLVQRVYHILSVLYRFASYIHFLVSHCVIRLIYYDVLFSIYIYISTSCYVCIYIYIYCVRVARIIYFGK